jgi:hypothetical protein
VFVDSRCRGNDSSGLTAAVRPVSHPDGDAI